MNKEQYIRSRFKDLLNETLEERANDIKKNLYKDVRLNPKNEFDYIEEGKGMCESCGGMVNEGETCEECGSMYKGDIRELGGMDDGHPRFGKENFSQMTKSQVERLLRGDNDEDDDENDDFEFKTPVRDAIRSHKGRFKTPVRDAIRSHKGKFETPVRDAI